jgi:fumarate hydratase, class II
MTCRTHTLSTQQTFRIETDTMGEMKVPSEALWGAQTQRSLENFKVGNDRMPRSVIRALGILKKGAALANLELGTAPQGCLRTPSATRPTKSYRRKVGRALPPRRVADRLGHPNQYELPTKSSRTAPSKFSAAKSVQQKTRSPQRPRQQKSQSSNDVFPYGHAHRGNRRTRAVICSPISKNSHGELLLSKEQAFDKIIKVGRTHLMDATPLTLGQEFSGYRTQIEYGIERVEQSSSSPAPARPRGNRGRHGAQRSSKICRAGGRRKSRRNQRCATSCRPPTNSRRSPPTTPFVFAHGALKTLWPARL